MSNNDWQIQLTNAIPAEPSGLWTMAYEYLRGPALIRFITDKKTTWHYASKSGCTADGDLAAMIAQQACVLPGAPVGALIGKIGGSSAGRSDGKVFLVGSFAIIEIDANTSGPLYLTINDEVTGMTNNRGCLSVTIGIKPLSLASTVSTDPLGSATSVAPPPSNAPTAKTRGFPKTPSP